MRIRIMRYSNYYLTYLLPIFTFVYGQYPQPQPSNYQPTNVASPATQPANGVTADGCFTVQGDKLLGCAFPFERRSTLTVDACTALCLEFTPQCASVNWNPIGQTCDLFYVAIPAAGGGGGGYGGQPQPLPAPAYPQPQQASGYSQPQPVAPQPYPSNPVPAPAPSYPQPQSSYPAPSPSYPSNSIQTPYRKRSRAARQAYGNGGGGGGVYPQPGPAPAPVPSPGPSYGGSSGGGGGTPGVATPTCAPQLTSVPGASYYVPTGTCSGSGTTAAPGDTTTVAGATTTAAVVTTTTTAATTTTAGQDCTVPLFQEADKLLIGFAERVVTAATLEECLDACVNSVVNEGFICRSGMIFYQDGQDNCILNTESKDTQPELYVDAGGEVVDYFEPDCINARNSRFVVKEEKSAHQPAIIPSNTDVWTDWGSCKADSRTQVRYKQCSSPKPTSCRFMDTRPCVVKRVTEDFQSGFCDPREYCCALFGPTGQLECNRRGIIVIDGKRRFCPSPRNC